MLEKRKENAKHSKEIAKKLDKAKLSQAREKLRMQRSKNYNENYEKRQLQQRQQQVQQKRTATNCSACLSAGRAARGLANIFQQLSK